MPADVGAQYSRVAAWRRACTAFAPSCPAGCVLANPSLLRWVISREPEASGGRRCRDRSFVVPPALTCFEVLGRLCSTFLAATLEHHTRGPRGYVKSSAAGTA
eukprot:364590-Chlamydomonas_euryale.AAC.10